MLTKAILNTQLKSMEELFVLTWMLPNLVDKAVWYKFIAGEAYCALPRRDGSVQHTDFKDAATSLFYGNELFLGAQSKQSKRILIKETFEILTNYAEKTNQFDKFRLSKFYALLRILRNATSHRDMGTIEWPKDMIKAGVFEVSHKTVSLSYSQQGQEPDIGAGELLELIQDVRRYYTEYFE